MKESVLRLYVSMLLYLAEESMIGCLSSEPAWVRSISLPSSLIECEQDAGERAMLLMRGFTEGARPG